jgi:hypothetical protein
MPILDALRLCAGYLRLLLLIAIFYAKTAS